MELSIIIIRKIFMMFILIVVGFVCTKAGMIDVPTNKKLSLLSLKLVSPMLIFASYQTEYSDRVARNLLLSILIAVITYVIQIALAFLLVRKKNNGDYQLERLSLIFGNVGYFGIPLIESLYGSEGAMYLTAYITMFNLLLWTVGDGIMTGKVSGRSILKGFLTPVTAAVVLGLILFFCRVRLPELIMEPIRAVGNMNTPFAMIVAGATLASTSILSCLKRWSTYRMLFCKMILVPVVSTVLLSLLPFDSQLLLIGMITVSCPIAAACPMLSVLYDKDSAYSSQIFAVSTLISIVTMPLIFLLGTVLL